MADDMHEFEIVQGGVVVASVSAPDRASALSEIMHYARQYAEDGPCLIRVKLKPVKRRARFEQSPSGEAK